MTYELKRLTTKNLESALEKAGVYRDLNQPEEAESICRDVLDVEPKNAHALRLLGLSLTDQLAHTRRAGVFEEAIATFAKLEAEYDRTYYAGVAWERAAKAHLERGEAHSAMASFEHAMHLFEDAERLGPPDAPDPILRWNRCVRLVTTHPLLLKAASEPMEAGVYSSD